LIDGPVDTSHPDLAPANVRGISTARPAACGFAGSDACRHGTFIAGILAARRNCAAPGMCPGCTLLVRPVFAEARQEREQMPTATPAELAAAIVDCVDAGARVINLSLALTVPASKREPSLNDALNQAVRRGAIVVVAAGNQGTVGSTAITRHPWVIPVVACDCRGRPTRQSNLAGSIGTRGLSAPGEAVTSLDTAGHSSALGGTSVAVPFVTGATALLWSAFPGARATEIKLALTRTCVPRRASVAPPLLDVAAAYQMLSNARPGGSFNG
jgi:subtilisin family serine protease